MRESATNGGPLGQACWDEIADLGPHASAGASITARDVGSDHGLSTRLGGDLAGCGSAASGRGRAGRAPPADVRPNHADLRAGAGSTRAHARGSGRGSSPRCRRSRKCSPARPSGRRPPRRSVHLQDRDPLESSMAFTGLADVTYACRSAGCASRRPVLPGISRYAHRFISRVLPPTTSLRTPPPPPGAPPSPARARSRHRPPPRATRRPVTGQPPSPSAPMAAAKRPAPPPAGPRSADALAPLRHLGLAHGEHPPLLGPAFGRARVSPRPVTPLRPGLLGHAIARAARQLARLPPPDP